MLYGEDLMRGWVETGFGDLIETPEPPNWFLTLRRTTATRRVQNGAGSRKSYRTPRNSCVRQECLSAF